MYFHTNGSLSCVLPPEIMLCIDPEDFEYYSLQLDASSCVSYTESYLDLQQSYLSVQQSYRTRKFELECSISAPVQSTVHRMGHTTLKMFLRLFNYRSFEGIEAPEGCESAA